jgi:2-dehydro-3-deoxyphosphogluconate aldolase/(4S)-4-hydroxy-2-oxoglutarate aldolase
MASPIGRRTLFAAGALGAVALAGCATTSVAATSAAASGDGTTDGLPNLAPDATADAFARQRVVPVLRDETASAALRTARAWIAAGCSVIELTTSTPDVFSAARTLVKEGITVGIGTMRNREHVAMAADAGASFVLSFATFPALIEEATARGITPIPGTATPTEVYASLAAPIIKVFPAATLGIPYLEALRTVYPGIRTTVTGGITDDPADAIAWLTAGATAVGPAGSLLGTAEDLGDATLQRRIGDYLSTVQSAVL